MKNEKSSNLSKVDATQSAVDVMAVVTLSPEKYAAEVYQPFKAKLASAIDSVRAIDYDITTTAGMGSAVKCRALFRDMRVAADKERKARKEPIAKIGKLLESGFDQFEERATPLEEMFDADIKAEEGRKEAEKAAKIKAERDRVDAIETRIQAIRNAPLGMAGKSSSEILVAREAVLGMDINEEMFGEQAYIDKAMRARSDAFNILAAAFDAAVKAEAAAVAAEQSRLAEIARIAAEREELAKWRADAVESTRLAQIENERIASEQAAERKRIEVEHSEERRRLVALHAEQEAAAAALAEQAAASLRAERAAQERAASDAQAVLAAEAKRLADERQAFEDEKAALSAAAQKPREEDRATDILTQREDDLLIDVEKNAKDEVLTAFTDAPIDEDLTDEEIVTYFADAFGFNFGDALARLEKIDFAALRAQGAAA